MKLIKLLFISAVFVMVTACAGLNIGANDTGPKIAVQLATLKVLDNSKDPALRGQRMHEIISAARDLVQGNESTTVAEIEKSVRAKIDNLVLDRGDVIMVNMLIDVVKLEISKRVGDGILDPEKAVKVDAVLSWIDDAVVMYGY